MSGSQLKCHTNFLSFESVVIDRNTIAFHHGTFVKNKIGSTNEKKNYSKKKK